MLLWIHILTCFWIYLGAQDCENGKWLEMSSTETSWLFIPGSDFSEDPRTIYE